MNKIMDDDDNFIHPWGAQAASRFHAGFTTVLNTVAFPFRWLLNKAFGMDKLEAKFQNIIDGKDEK
jgi:hypothetical protein